MTDTKKETKLVPKLRFKEFEGEWVKTQFEDLVKVNARNGLLPQFFVYIDLESVSKGQLIIEKRVQKVDAPSRAQRNVNRNDILFQTVRPYQKNNYFFDKDGDYIASTGYAVLSTKKENSSKFLYQVIHTDKFVTNVLKRCTGTSYPAINTDDLKTISITKPSLPEQQKIASFLTAVDKRIEQLTKKKKLLEEYKKGVMQKIFNQEIRFKIKNENGELVEPLEWEEKRLSKLADINKGTQKNADQLSQEGQYPVINGGKEPSGYFDEFNTEAETITISEGGNSCGYVNYLESPFWSGGHCYTLTTNSRVHKEYLYHYLKHYETEIMKLRVGSGLPNIQKKDIELFEVQLPSPKEQAHIASFVDKIDQQYKAFDMSSDQMTTFKKGLLQQMFI